MAIRRQKQFIAQLIRAARGQRSPSAGDVSASPPPPPQPSPSTRLLPCFPLQRHHFGQLTSPAPHINDGASSRFPGVATPSDFHSYLCKAISCARERVVLASLYIGVGSNAVNISQPFNGLPSNGIKCKEDELLDALHNAASNKNLKKLQILLDANRALRKVTFTDKNRQSHGSSAGSIQTNSAEAVFSRINSFVGDPKNQSNGLFLFPVNDKRLCAILPSPLDEVAGVFHIKAYIVDDELILSGANLSEEYFSNRLDRYLLFSEGGGGLVDFYADLCDILCEYAIKYDGPSNHKAEAGNLSSLFSLQDEETKKQKLELSLMHLFDGNNYEKQSECEKEAIASGPIVAHVIPTFQMPTAFLGRPLKVQPDTEVTQNLLTSALNSEQSPSVRLSSAYLNLSDKLLSVLTMGIKNNNVGAPYILTAGTISHGFSPKPGGPGKKKSGIADKIKATIPTAFLTLVEKAAQSIIASGGKVLLYERPGWTFHAKGVWMSAKEDNAIEQTRPNPSHPELINNPSSLLATIIGLATMAQGVKTLM